MIFYFSGTGNSLYVARSIAKKQSLHTYDIAELMKKKRWVFVPEESELVGFVFPVYAWGPPDIVLEFIKRMRLVQNKNFIFAVCTCGSSAGNCMKILKAALSGSSISLHADFSVVMPDNYIVAYSLPSKEKQELILKNASAQLESIEEDLKARSAGSRTNKGAMPFIMSSVVNPLFKKFANPAKKFHVADTCTACGLCTRICPAQNISLTSSGKPEWGQKCYSCLACLHRCPGTAIEYGQKTQGKARYYNPYCAHDDA